MATPFVRHALGVPVTVVIPSVLAPAARGQTELQVPDGSEPDGSGTAGFGTAGSGTLRGVLDALAAEYPVLGRRLRDERGVLRRHVNVYVGGQDVRRLEGLDTAVGPDEEVLVIQSVAGG